MEGDMEPLRLPKRRVLHRVSTSGRAPGRAAEWTNHGLKGTCIKDINIDLTSHVETKFAENRRAENRRAENRRAENRRAENRRWPIARPASRLEDRFLVAANLGDVEGIRELLRLGMGFDYKDTDGQTALHIAASLGNLDVVQTLLKVEYLDVNSQDKQGRSALHIATSLGNLDVVQELLKVKYLDVNSKDTDGKTALHHAVCKYHHRVVQEPLHPGVFQDRQFRFTHEHKLFQEALLRDSQHRLALEPLPRVVQELLRHKDIDVNSRDSDGRTALYHASYTDNYTGVLELLGHKDLDVKSQDNYGQNALYAAASRGHLIVARTLLNHGDVGVDCGDNNGQTSLSCAAFNGHLAIVKELLNRRDVVINNKDKRGRTVLHDAASGGYPDIIHELLDHESIDVDGKDYNGRTPLHDAAARGDDRAIQQILKWGADISCQDNCGRTPLHEAAASGGNGLGVRGLLEAGADVSCQDNSGRTPLHDAAAARGDGRAIQQILKWGADISCQDNNGRTPLHDAAAARGDVRAIRQLLACGADLSCQDHNGRTPLHDAASEGNGFAIKTLLDEGADISCQDNNGRTPLHDAAASGGNGLTIYVLLDKGADISCQDNNGRTPLHYAIASGGSYHAIKVLLDKGANVSCQDKNGHSPLHDAVNYFQTLAHKPRKSSTEISIEEFMFVVSKFRNTLGPGHPDYLACLNILKTTNRGRGRRIDDNYDEDLPGVHTKNPTCPKKKPGNSSRSDEEPLTPEAEYDSISSATLSNEGSPKPETQDNLTPSASSDDFTREVSSSRASCAALDLSPSDESKSEDDCEGIDYDKNEDEEGENDDDSYYDMEISHNLTDTGAYRYHGGGTSDAKGKGKLVSTKRSLSQNFGGQSNGQEDDESSDRPSKRKKGINAQGGSLSQIKKPFACPYFKEDLFKYVGCAQWKSTNLKEVKEHCKSQHLKLWCNVCKEFQANTQSKIDSHLRDGNCQRKEAAPGSAFLMNVTNSELRDALDTPRTCTWERVYVCLFHRNIPNPYWSETEFEAAQACHGELSIRILRCVPIPFESQPQYQLELAKRLKDYLALEEDAVKKVMIEYNEDWAARGCNQVQFSSTDGSGASSQGMDDISTSKVSSETRHSTTPEQMHILTTSHTEQSQPSIVHNHTTFSIEPGASILLTGSGEYPSPVASPGGHSQSVAATSIVQGYTQGQFNVPPPNAPGPFITPLEASVEIWADLFDFNGSLAAIGEYGDLGSHQPQ